MIELNRIYNEDCLEGMKRIPDKSIDLILTDPPYGKKADKGTSGFGTAKNRRYVGGWDSEIPSKEIFDEMFRVSKNLSTEPLRTVMANNKAAVVTVKLTNCSQNLGHWSKVRTLLNTYADYDLKDDEILLFRINGVFRLITKSNLI